MPKKLIYLPTTEKDFDKLIKVLVKKYKLPSKEHATAVVAMRIMHLPPEQATCTLEYLGHSVLKNMAYQVAEHKTKMVRHKMQVDQLDALLKANPHDQEVLDQLDKEVQAGSEYAKEVMSKYVSDVAELLEPVGT